MLESTHWLARGVQRLAVVGREARGEGRFVGPAVAAEPLRFGALGEVDALGELVLVDRSLRSEY